MGAWKSENIGSLTIQSILTYAFSAPVRELLGPIAGLADAISIPALLVFTLTHTDTGAQRTILTSPKGIVEAPLLSVGSY